MGQKEPTKSVGISSLDTSFLIIEEMRKTNGAGITQIADRTGISKSTVHKHLTTLHDHDFVIKNADEYNIGLRFLDIGGWIQDQIEGSKYIQSKMQEVVEESGETAHFGIEQNWEAIVLFRSIGSKGVVTNARVGKHFQLHQTAAGKAIMSEWEDEEINQYVQYQRVNSKEEDTITDKETFVNEINQARDQGYAYNRGETTNGLYAIAVPVTTTENKILGSLTVAGPKYRLQDDEVESSTVTLLMKAANEIELEIEYDK